MIRLRYALFFAFLGLAHIIFTTPAFCDEDEFDFSVDPFFSNSAGISLDKWHLRMGGGGSFITSGYRGHIPPILGFFLINQGGSSFFLNTGGISSVPLDLKLHNAGEFEGSLTRAVTPSLSLGLLGGASTGHDNSVGLDEAFPGVHFVYFGAPFPVEFRYELRASKVMPMLQYGPRYALGRTVLLRPYLMAAAGGYQIAQTIYIVLAGSTEEYTGTTKYYSGAAGGLGLSFIFDENYTTSIEARYERVFCPGPTLAFFVPTLQFGYIF